MYNGAKMIDYCKAFRDKKVTVMGLGVQGRGVGDSEFLAQCGAELIITDLKGEEELAPSVRRLDKYKRISFVLGEHRLKDFQNRDLILKAASVPLDSLYIREAKKHGIPVEMSASLFAKIVSIPVIGITGTRGKSTVTHLICEILKKAGTPVLLGGNVRGVGTLPLLEETHLPAGGDSIALFELDSWQLQGFGESKLSPHIAVFTNFFPDHLNYYHGDLKQYFADKAHIFEYQTEKNYLITTEKVLALARKYGYDPRGTVVIPETLSRDWHLKMPGEHNRANASFARAAAQVLHVEELLIREVIESFAGIPGRLQLIREIDGIKFFNDTTATTPEATIAALQTLGSAQSKVVLIMGGSDKELDMSELLSEIPKYCKGVVLLPGTGTDKLDIKEAEAIDSLSDAVEKACALAEVGDSIVLSPAFTSFGMFQNEFDRGDQFTDIVNKLE